MSFEDADRLAASLGLNRQTIAQRVDSFDLKPDGRMRLASSWAAIKSLEDRFVTHLYDVFSKNPHLNAVLANEERVKKLKGIQKQYLKELICDPIDQTYVLKRLLIGLIHHRIRIAPQWYLASYAHFLCDQVDPIFSSSEHGDEARERMITLLQSVLFDASLVLDAYGLEEEARRIETVVEHEASRRDQGGNVNGLPVAQGERTSKDLVAPMSHIRLTTEDTKNRIEFLGLTAVDLERLRSLQSVFTEHGSDVLSAFYRYLLESPEYQKLVRPEQVDHLVDQVRTYWHEFLNGSFDRPYAASRMRIGVIHERIGITPQIYFAGLARQVAGYIRLIPTVRPDFTEVMRSFFRALLFDVTFVIDAYMEARGETLLRTEGYAKELMAGLSSSVVVVDDNLRIQFANKEFVALVGIDPPLLCKMQLADALHMPELMLEIEKLSSDVTGKVAGFYPFGSHIFRPSIVKLDQQPGHSQSFHAILLEDVSDILRVSADIETNESLYASLANSVSAVLWEMDFETKTIEKVSRQTLELTGHSHEVFLGQTAAWFNCIVEEDRERFVICCATIQVGDKSTCDYRIRRADEQEVWVRSYISRTSSKTSTVRLSAVTVDITQQLRAERLRLDAVGKLSGGIAHVINNCLTVIVNNIELQALTLGGISGLPFLQDSLKACQQAASVSKKLQAFAGGQMLRPSTVSLTKFIEASIPALQTTVGSTIKISVRNLAQNWKCRVDLSQLSVSLEHLCANSRDAMPLGGSITLVLSDVSRDTLSFDDPGFNRDWVQLSVVDTGCGMTEEVRKRAVEPFFGTYSLAERRGLGLSFVYGFVTQSGGHLLIESQLGVGTSVSLRLPRHQESSVPDELLKGNSTSPSVLIVDDDENVAQSIAMQFRYMGLKAHTAYGETDALDILRKTHIDVLMMDVVLENGCNGIDLAKQIYSLYPRLKVIIVSGYLQNCVASNELPEGWKFLAKPFSVQSLNGALMELGVPAELRL